MRTLAPLLMFAVIAYAIPARADAAADPLSHWLPDPMIAVDEAEARHDYTTEFKLLLPLAEQGGWIAEGKMADMYRLGHGVSQDYAEADRWFRKAAEQGDPLAQGILGMMYAMGQGVPKDETEAARWERKAADQGNTIAQDYLGEIYRHGWGVPKDYVQAYMWFNLAAGGITGTGAERAEAAQSRDALEHSMTPEQIAEAQKRSAAWQPISSAK